MLYRFRSKDQSLGDLKCMKKLNASQMEMNGDGMGMIGEMSKLELLDLSGCRMPVDSSKHLQGEKNQRELNISENNCLIARLVDIGKSI